MIVMKRIILLLLSMYMALGPAFATTYYFSTSGNDANNGLSSTTPKKSIAAANALMSGGNTILFKRGDIWYIPGDGIDLTNRSNCTLNAYGTGNKPVIAGLLLVNDTWTYEGNFVWSNPTGYQIAHRVFVNSISRIGLQDKAGNNPVIGDLDALDEYLFLNGTLYIRHTSATTAPVNVVMSPGWNSPAVITMKNSTNITLRNIEFRGGGYTSTVRLDAPCSDILIDSCMVTRSSQSGIFAINTLQNMDVVENLTIQNCVIDKSWTTAENNLKSTVSLTGDGVCFFHGVKSSVIKNNVITNYGHNGISITAYSFATGIYGVKYNKAEGNDISAGNSAYMHAIGVAGYPDKAMYNIYKGNYCHDFTTANTIAGNTNFVFGNIFENVVVSPLEQHSQAPHGINMSTWNLADFNGTVTAMECKNNWVVNNTLINTDTYTFLLDNTAASGSTTTHSGNKIYNNLMLNFGMDTSYVRDDPNSSPPPRVGLRILSNVANAVTYIRNNDFWVDYDQSATKKVALYKTSYYTAAQLTNCAECGGGNVTGNTQLDPQLGTFFSLTASSPAALRSGGTLYETSIIGWGLPSAEFTDYYGNPWPDTGISVGAIQY